MSYSIAQLCAAIRNLESEVFVNRDYGNNSFDNSYNGYNNGYCNNYFNNVVSLPKENSLRIDMLSQMISESGGGAVENVERVISNQPITQLLTQNGLIKDSDGNYIPDTKTITQALQYLYNNVNVIITYSDIDLYKDMII